MSEVSFNSTGWLATGLCQRRFETELRHPIMGGNTSAAGSRSVWKRCALAVSSQSLLRPRVSHHEAGVVIDVIDNEISQVNKAAGVGHVVVVHRQRQAGRNQPRAESLSRRAKRRQGDRAAAFRRSNPPIARPKWCHDIGLSVKQHVSVCSSGAWREGGVIVRRKTEAVRAAEYRGCGCHWCRKLPPGIHLRLFFSGKLELRQPSHRQIAQIDAWHAGDADRRVLVEIKLRQFKTPGRRIASAEVEYDPRWMRYWSGPVNCSSSVFAAPPVQTQFKRRLLYVTGSRCVLRRYSRSSGPVTDPASRADHHVATGTDGIDIELVTPGQSASTCFDGERMSTAPVASTKRLSSPRITQRWS